MEAMSPRSISTALALAVALGAALFGTLCGGSKPPEKAASGVTSATAAKAIEYFRVDPATAGTLRGKIVFEGAKPARQLISMEAEAGCQQAHAGHPVYEEPVVTGETGGLANAFVYIQSGLQEKNFEPPKAPVSLDQHGCMVVPRVIAIRAAQPLSVTNSDAVSQNIRP